MKKLKDLFYDFNDIMVALIIVAAAALVITANIDSILGYPAAIAAEIQPPQEETPTHYAENPPLTDPGSDASGGGTTGPAVDGQGTGGNDGNTEAGGQDGTQTAGGGQNSNSGQDAGDGQGGGAGSPGNAGADKPDSYSVYINYGQTADQIADTLIGVGLFKDRQEFRDAVTAAGAESRLQAGTFIIPSNATPAEVVSIITH